MIPQHVLDNSGAMIASPSSFATVNCTFWFTRRRTDLNTLLCPPGHQIVATHMHDKQAILALVAGGERDLGGEG